MGHVIHDHFKMFFVVLCTQDFHERISIGDRRGLWRHDHHNVLRRHIKIHDVGRDPGACVNEQEVNILFQSL